MNVNNDTSIFVQNFYDDDLLESFANMDDDTFDIFYKSKQND